MRADGPQPSSRTILSTRSALRVAIERCASAAGVYRSTIRCVVARGRPHPLDGGRGAPASRRDGSKRTIVLRPVSVPSAFASTTRAPQRSTGGSYTSTAEASVPLPASPRDSPTTDAHDGNASATTQRNAHLIGLRSSSRAALRADSGPTNISPSARSRSHSQAHFHGPVAPRIALTLRRSRAHHRAPMRP